MLVSQVTTDIRDLLADNANYTPTDPGTVSALAYAPYQVIDSINFACKEYARRTGVSYLETTAAIATALTGSTVGTATIPLDYVDVVRVLYGGSQLLETDRKFEFQRSPVWEGVSGTTTKRWLKYDGSKVRLIPYCATWSTAANCTVGYIQAPTNVTSELTTTAGSFVVGQTYQIVSIGTTDFTLIGASANTVGLKFVATGVGTGTGTANECIDQRIPEKHQQYLKYCASAWLLQMNNDQQSFAVADKWMTMFNSLIGVA